MTRRPLLALAAVAAGVIWWSAAEDGRSLPAHAAAPSFALPDLAGQPRSLASFRGRPALLNFWATWCPPCRAELPELRALAQTHLGCLDVVGIAEDSGSAGDLRAFAQANALEYPILLDDGSAGRAYGVTTIPRSVLIDAQGRVLHTFTGTITAAQVDETLARVGLPIC